MMEQSLFFKKYLGEVTLKNGEHVKYLFPVTDSEIRTYEYELKTMWNNIQKNRKYLENFNWVLLDDLSYEQFSIVYVAIKKYGKHYWKLVWQQYLENSKKKS